MDWDDANAHPHDPRGHVGWISRPHENGFGLRLQDDVQTVLRTIVHDRIQLHRVGDLAAVAVWTTNTLG